MIFTELLRATNLQHKPRDILEHVDTGQMELATDHYTDGLDFWQLCCGVKGVPDDNETRLSILSIREDRLTRRIRWFMHCPTHNMICDALTQSGTFPHIMRLVNTGVWHMNTIATKPFTARRIRERRYHYDEGDLLRLEA
eukprot:7115475-Pyramimonas_sp.AAC.1